MGEEPRPRFAPEVVTANRKSERRTARHEASPPVVFHATLCTDLSPLRR